MIVNITVMSKSNASKTCSNKNDLTNSVLSTLGVPIINNASDVKDRLFYKNKFPTGLQVHAT